MISFVEASRHGRGRYLRVKLTIRIGEHGHEGTLTVTIGRIEFAHDGMLRYFEPEADELNPTLIDRELKTLKKRIKARRKHA